MFPRQRSHLVTGLEGGIDAQEALQAAGAHHASLVVQHQVHQVDVAHLHRLVLLATWHEQILFHAPVEEGTDLVGVDHLEADDVTHHGKGLVGGDHRLAIRVQIEKDGHLAILGDAFRQLTLGQQQLAIFPRSQPGTAIFELNDGEGVHLANL